MAKGKDDLILRDRLQFTLSGGNLAIVYGRTDRDWETIPLLKLI